MFITAEILWGILGFIITTVISIGLYIHRKSSERNENRLKTIEQNNQEIKENYIERFEEVNSNIKLLETNLRESNHNLGNKIHHSLGEVANRIAGLEIKLEREFRKKNECIAYDNVLLERIYNMEKDISFIKGKQNDIEGKHNK